jgi:hypothetical protein
MKKSGAYQQPSYQSHVCLYNNLSQKIFELQLTRRIHMSNTKPKMKCTPVSEASVFQPEDSRTRRVFLIRPESTTRKANPMTRPQKKRANRKSKMQNISAKSPIQFNWRRHWSKKVAPYLQEELVQLSLNVGMTQFDKTWKPGDAPCDYGRVRFNRIIKGKLSWYRPLCCCHYIALFSMAIGVLNYPDLEWRFLSGDLHTVPVGYGPDGEPRVVMDILFFDFCTAEQCIACTRMEVENRKTSAEAKKQWEQVFEIYATQIIPQLKVRAKELRQARQDGDGSLSGENQRITAGPE